MYTITASDRAKAVLLLIADRPPDVQLEIITGAIRGATEQAAQIVEQYGHLYEPRSITTRIAKEIRATE